MKEVLVFSSQDSAANSINFLYYFSGVIDYDKDLYFRLPSISFQNRFRDYYYRLLLKSCDNHLVKKLEKDDIPVLPYAIFSGLESVILRSDPRERYSTLNMLKYKPNSSKVQKLGLTSMLDRILMEDYLEDINYFKYDIAVMNHYQSLKEKISNSMNYIDYRDHNKKFLILINDSNYYNNLGIKGISEIIEYGNTILKDDRYLYDINGQFYGTAFFKFHILKTDKFDFINEMNFTPLFDLYLNHYPDRFNILCTIFNGIGEGLPRAIFNCFLSGVPVVKKIGTGMDLHIILKSDFGYDLTYKHLKEAKEKIDEIYNMNSEDFIKLREALVNSAKLCLDNQHNKYYILNRVDPLKYISNNIILFSRYKYELRYTYINNRLLVSSGIVGKDPNLKFVRRFIKEKIILNENYEKDIILLISPTPKQVKAALKLFKKDHLYFSYFSHKWYKKEFKYLSYFRIVLELFFSQILGYGIIQNEASPLSMSGETSSLPLIHLLPRINAIILGNPKIVEPNVLSIAGVPIIKSEDEDEIEYIVKKYLNLNERIKVLDYGINHIEKNLNSHKLLQINKPEIIRLSYIKSVIDALGRCLRFMNKEDDYTNMNKLLNYMIKLYAKQRFNKNSKILEEFTKLLKDKKGTSAIPIFLYDNQNTK